MRLCSSHKDLETGLMLHHGVILKFEIIQSFRILGLDNLCIALSSLASHTLRREEGSGHAATIELSTRQKLVITNQTALFVDRIRRQHLIT